MEWAAILGSLKQSLELQQKEGVLVVPKKSSTAEAIPHSEAKSFSKLSFA